MNNVIEIVNDDAYDIADTILDLWRLHSDKSSGLIDKSGLYIPVKIKQGDNLYAVNSIEYDQDHGIIISIGDKT